MLSEIIISSSKTNHNNNKTEKKTKDSYKAFILTFLKAILLRYFISSK